MDTSSTESASRELSPNLGTSFSEVDSLDSELVAAALASLELEEEGEEVYHLAIMDYETGINHRLEGATIQISATSCRLSADGLSFESKSCSKGSRADMVIHRNLGPTLIDKDLLVYQGDFSYTYLDHPCYPTSLVSGHWCM